MTFTNLEYHIWYDDTSYNVRENGKNEKTKDEDFKIAILCQLLCASL